MHSESHEYPGWFIVEGYDKYLVRPDGEVLIKNTGHRTYGGKMTSGYLVVGPYNTYVHRLICIAFHGLSPDDKPFVNHKDGDKKNNKDNSVEWCSPQENADHAWETGLIDNRKKTVVLDVLKDKEYVFDTRAEASEFVGRVNGYVSLTPPNDPYRLYARRYYIKLLVEYARPDLEVMRKFYIKVKSLTTGKVFIEVSPTDAAKRIGVDPSLVMRYLATGQQYLKKHLLKRYDDPSEWWNGERLTLAINKSGIGILILNLENDTVVEFKSTLAADGYLGIPYHRFASKIRKGEQFVTDKILVKRADDDSPWLNEDQLNEYIERNKGDILIKSELLEKPTIVSNLSQASSITKTPISTIRYRLKVGGMSKSGYEFSYVGRR